MKRAQTAVTAITTPTLPAHDLAAEILRRRKTDLAKKINLYHRKNSILSDISECERQMVYSVLDWETRPLHDEDLQARFDVGNLWEREIIRALQGMGFDFIMAQAPVTIKGRDGELIATGKIDGFIKFNGKQIPVEIKSMHPNVFNMVDSVEDFQKKVWLRKYVRQLTLYLYGNNQEGGLFILTDGMGKWKIMPFALDYGEAEASLQRLEQVARYIKAKTYVERIPYSKEMCGKCPFADTCLPDILRSGLELIDMPELEAGLKRMMELEPSAAEWKVLDTICKDTAKRVGKDFIVGTSFKCEIRKVQTTRIDTKKIPPDVASQCEVTSEQMRISFVPLGG